MNEQDRVDALGYVTVGLDDLAALYHEAGDEDTAHALRGIRDALDPTSRPDDSPMWRQAYRAVRRLLPASW